MYNIARVFVLGVNSFVVLGIFFTFTFHYHCDLWEERNWEKCFVNYITSHKEETHSTKLLINNCIPINNTTRANVRVLDWLDGMRHSLIGSPMWSVKAHSFLPAPAWHGLSTRQPTTPLKSEQIKSII